jgi:hypothetical protein
MPVGPCGPVKIISESIFHETEGRRLLEIQDTVNPNESIPTTVTYPADVGLRSNHWSGFNSGAVAVLELFVPIHI